MQKFDNRQILNKNINVNIIKRNKGMVIQYKNELSIVVKIYGYLVYCIIL